MTQQKIAFFSDAVGETTSWQATFDRAYRCDEATAVKALLEFLSFSPDMEQKTNQFAAELVNNVRASQKEKAGIESFMLHYDLSTEEGILLMCLAEALLRIPDKTTEHLLIRDKLTSADWDARLGESESTFVNMATWGLALSGKILRPHKLGYFKKRWRRMIRKSGEPVIRRAVWEAMKLMSEHFVLGRSIDEALKRSQAALAQGYRYSYDMLGEAARTQADADHYFEDYYHAISALGGDQSKQAVHALPSISVKLSALHPRYEYAKKETVVPFLVERVKQLVLHAKSRHIAVTIDAEEADRLDISLTIFATLFADNELTGWSGLGLAVQAYQKRAMSVIDWLVELARQHHRQIPVRLVKGAYWDSEIKHSQMEGLSGYPVFTRKVNTDLSYLACAKKLLAAQDVIYPQFATHNAYSVAAILTMMGGRYRDYHFEFQNLQGMGKELHNYLVSSLNIPCRIYAPVGSHEDLLPYLVRRLLENGANSSFVNRIADKKVAVEVLTESPVAKIETYTSMANPKIPLPQAIFGHARVNSAGFDLSSTTELTALSRQVQQALQRKWCAAPLSRQITQGKPVWNPADTTQQVGLVEQASEQDVDQALENALAAFPEWDRRGVKARATIIEAAGDLLQQHQAELIALAIVEAGKTLPDAVSEVREAIDFCRYYALEARKHLSDQTMPGYTGESNILRMRGRGPMLCISPWNFPIAIFTGQIVAALVAGNTVIAKPASQTCLTAALVTELVHKAGVPSSVLQLLPGRGSVVGDRLVKSPAIQGVLFTGSDSTAQSIQRGLTDRGGAMVPFIAETGGINAMLVDSTALPEQLVQDVLTSAFASAGQRCSALRVLFVQDDIADDVIAMLAGAMAEMTVGQPMLLSTDVGPVIDASAWETLQQHADEMAKRAKLIAKVPLSSACQSGHFMAPQAYELSELALLREEVFGPILHVLRYRRCDLDQVIEQINDLGYGLTFGIQSRIDTTVEYIEQRIKAGNIYVNRNMIGAVVGVQPFGGSRLSGTGPKAGGPHYLLRLCMESTLTTDTTAAGGNASLMAMSEE